MEDCQYHFVCTHLFRDSGDCLIHSGGFGIRCGRVKGMVVLAYSCSYLCQLGYSVFDRGGLTLGQLADKTGTIGEREAVSKKVKTDAEIQLPISTCH